MLAQNFKTAADLGITEPQRAALGKVLVLLETGKLRNCPMGGPSESAGMYSGQFNMNQWSAENECGTIACIGGTAELVGTLAVREMSHAAYGSKRLHELFYPYCVDTLKWTDITTTQAATALRSYLSTGDARWDLAVTTG
jgi:hypothetical protein